MATQRRNKNVIQTFNGMVSRSIVSSILTRKNEFTSTDIAEVTGASPRHSRRTLAELVRRRVLRAQRKQTPFTYTVANRDSLRRLIAQ